MVKRIVLCADDYGQAKAISQGIFTLIQNGRLSATSCLVNTPYWSEHAKWLIPVQSLVDIGLHFNLTEGKALSPSFIEAYGEDLFSLPNLIRKAILRQLDCSIIEAECHAQIDAFEAAMGFLPQFIDGHQHVHQFPVIRTALLTAYEKRLRSQNAYIRLVNERVRLKDYVVDFKKVVITAMGTKPLTELLQKNNIQHNQSFAGIYRFNQSSQYRQLFLRFINEVKEGGIVMCHPGFFASDKEDAIANARHEEYQYLVSNHFLTDCHQHGVVLGRFS